jgi:8-oxo-dGTP diphosphatase
MKRYVAGFLFSKDRKTVLLIKKNRPEWQAGRYNAVGGKIEENETPLEAMNREFLEEASICDLDWQPTADLQGKTWTVHFFAAFSDLIWFAKNGTDESLSVQSSSANDNLWLPNLRLLISIALDNSGISKPVFLWDDTEPAEKDNPPSPSAQ